MRVIPSTASGFFVLLLDLPLLPSIEGEIFRAEDLLPIIEGLCEGVEYPEGFSMLCLPG